MENLTATTNKLAGDFTQLLTNTNTWCKQAENLDRKKEWTLCDKIILGLNTIDMIASAFRTIDSSKQLINEFQITNSTPTPKIFDNFTPLTLYRINPALLYLKR